mgnify:CR=1 FL=1
MKRSIRTRLHEIIFEADTRGGKIFDITLIALILLSVAVIMAESVPSIRLRWGRELYAIEWVFTVLFTIEYITRIYTVRVKKTYIFSFYGLIDFLAILPTYLNMLLPGMHYLLIIRLILSLIHISEPTRPY